jgi:lipopolysaccharide transport system ATP-binding protein
MPAVLSLCTKTVLLDRGEVVIVGETDAVVKRYVSQVIEHGPQDVPDRPDRQGSGRLRFTRIAGSVTLGADSQIRLDYRAETPLRNVEISIGLFTVPGEGVVYLGNHLTGESFAELPASGTIVCHLDRAALMPGIYTMNVYCTVSGIVADWIQDAARLDVAEGDFFGTGRLPPSGYGYVLTQHRWTVDPASRPTG